MISWRTISWTKKLWIVAGACFILFLGNVAGLLWVGWLRKTHHEPAYTPIIDLRALGFTPLSLDVITVFLALGLLFVAKPHVKPRNEVQEAVKLIAFAMLCGLPLAMVLAALKLG